MRSVLVRNTDNCSHSWSVVEQQPYSGKSRSKGILGSVGAKMRNLPYYCVAALSILAAMMAGIMIDSGADYIRYQADMAATVKLLNAMEIQHLSDIRISEL